MPPRRIEPRRSLRSSWAAGTAGGLLAVGVLAGLDVLTAPPGRSPERGTPEIGITVEPGGLHEVLGTPRGPVHVYQPAGYQPETAGVLVYVHGYYTDVADACRRHRLTAQFAASGRNALFIAPEAPAADAEPVRWERLGELLETVANHPDFTLPQGPTVALAHSGGFRTVERWLASGLLDTVVLLDGLYGGESALSRWLEGPGNRPWSLMLVGHDTARRAERFAARYRDAVVLDSIPAAGAAARGRGRIVVVRSDLGHMELVTAQRAIPAMLALTPLAQRR